VEEGEGGREGEAERGGRGEGRTANSRLHEGDGKEEGEGQGEGKEEGQREGKDKDRKGRSRGVPQTPPPRATAGSPSSGPAPSSGSRWGACPGHTQAGLPLGEQALRCRCPKGLDVLQGFCHCWLHNRYL